jgi:2'-5' RNA ligase
VLQTGGWYLPEARPFLAHTTVARVAKDARVRREGLEAPPPLAFDAGTVSLYRSRLGPGGARYEALRTVELGAPAPASIATSTPCSPTSTRADG